MSLLDVDKQSLEIGDRVAYQQGGRYPDLRVTTVKGFTPKMVKTGLGTVHPYKLAKLFKQTKDTTHG